MPASRLNSDRWVRINPRLFGDSGEQFSKSVAAVQHQARRQANAPLGHPCMTEPAAPARLPFQRALSMLAAPPRLEFPVLHETACSSAQELAFPAGEILAVLARVASVNDCPGEWA
ncbi:hypothetical protein CDV31_008620 [Fusarium ambrosium]|uniref:Uncharacterized protein n=1 Tax=Fusarium ambrosium TaxID=131363 RepID=A0A428TZB4_9HYPO|nr:hypothetical protein CDV31_008620 [Fusarium ambrosium]